MQTQKTNNRAAEPKASTANRQFLQLEPAEVSDLDLLAVAGGINDTRGTVHCGCSLEVGTVC